MKPDNLKKRLKRDGEESRLAVAASHSVKTKVLLPSLEPRHNLATHI